VCVSEGGREMRMTGVYVCERERREGRAMTGIFTVPIATP
jgi:hypothetical protein